MTRTPLLAATVLAAGTVAAPASAVERENHVGVGVGGLVEDQHSPDVGFSLGAHWTYGLSDAFNLMTEATWSFVPLVNPHRTSVPGHRPSRIGTADVGVAYVFDVISWVPYVGVMMGGYALGGGTVSGTKVFPGAVLAGGVDYRFGRSVAVGIAVREHMLVTEVGTYPSFTQALARVEMTWGW